MIKCLVDGCAVHITLKYSEYFDHKQCILIICSSFSLIEFMHLLQSINGDTWEHMTTKDIRLKRQNYI